MDSTSYRACSTEIFNTEKYPYISGPMQFKLMLFKSQLYFCVNGQLGQGQIKPKWIQSYVTVFVTVGVFSVHPKPWPLAFWVSQSKVQDVYQAVPLQWA